jgi:hypothetical protein
MSVHIRAVEYYTTTVPGSPDAAYGLLSGLAGEGVNLLAFNAIPGGLEATQLVLFPEDGARLAAAAQRLRMAISGPTEALLIQGDDELGALAKVHRQLDEADVHPYASAGLVDSHGGFAYLVYLKRDEYAAAKRALGL